MRRYAQLLNGRVIDVREAESLGQLALIFGPQTYWIDVTDIDCEIGYVTRFVEGAGVIYVDPDTPEPVEEIVTVEQAREYKMIALKREYLAERDKFRWVVFREAKYEGDIMTVAPIQYGFDCDPKSIINFVAAMIPALFGEPDEKIDCLAYFDNGTKGIAQFNINDMKIIYNSIRKEQIMVNIKYNEKKKLVYSLNNIDKIMDIKWNDEEE
jgi:hypothetical protein